MIERENTVKMRVFHMQAAEGVRSRLPQQQLNASQLLATARGVLAERGIGAGDCA